ncbi:MAG: GntR family transcriptional regulator [Burkholderiales bacterium]|jgi:DNA-binding GntR family transcriptional regulator
MAAAAPVREPAGADRPGLAERARVRLAEMIVTLQLEPGSLCTAPELAERIGFGRTPVREALKRLEQEHLVRIVERHGVRITEINADEQLRMLETRRALERIVAGRAARLRTDAEAARFGAFARSLRAIGRSGEVIEFVRLHPDASRLAMAAARNRFAASALEPLHAMSRRFYVYHHRKARDLQRACEHHARVMRAIADADEAGAVRASDEVLDYVEAFTRATLAEGR